MATYTIISTFLRFFLHTSFFCSCLLSSSYSEQLSPSHIVSVSSLLPPAVCNRASSPLVSRKPTFEVFSKYSPCSPLNDHGKANTPSLEEIMRRDQLRVHSRNSWHLIQKSDSEYLNQTKSVSFPAKIKDKRGGEYYIIVAFGKPKQNVSLLLDTGSDLTWTQCKPCIRSCFKQRDAIYDPSKSKTYSSIPCHSTTCDVLKVEGINNTCSFNKCAFTIAYGDTSYSNGFFSTEKLTITKGSKSLVLNNYRFGCANNNSVASDTNEGASGIMGLDRGPSSIIRQTSEKHFSYCLPSSYGSTGYITFGKADDVKNKFIKFTPITTTSQQSEFYDIRITGISVAGEKLPIQSTVFSKPPTIIDSGTVITRLPPAAYSALRSAFRKNMMKYKLIKPVSIFDTCYNLKSYDTVTIPKITFHFLSDVDLDLDVRGILLVSSNRKVCLAFAGNDDDTSDIIFGNVQQRGYEWHYDVAGRRVGFGPGRCS